MAMVPCKGPAGLIRRSSWPLCEGPMGGYRTTFLNQQYLFGLSGSGLEILNGRLDAASPWGYLNAFFPGQGV